MSHPASAIYPRASAAWVALLEVDFPISLAFSSNNFKSSPVAPEIACTLDIANSKSTLTLVAYPANATIGADSPIIAFPALFIFWPALSSLEPKFSNFSPASASSFFILFVSKLLIALLVLLISSVNNSSCASVSFTPFSAFLSWFLYVFNCFSAFCIDSVFSSSLALSFSNSCVFLVIPCLAVSICFLYASSFDVWTVIFCSNKLNFFLRLSKLLSNPLLLLDAKLYWVSNDLSSLFKALICVVAPLSCTPSVTNNSSLAILTPTFI